MRMGAVLPREPMAEQFETAPRRRQEPAGLAPETARTSLAPVFEPAQPALAATARAYRDRSRVRRRLRTPRLLRTPRPPRIPRILRLPRARRLLRTPRHSRS